MAKKKNASTALVSGTKQHATDIKKAVDGRQDPDVGGSKRKRFNASRYKALFIPQRIRIESDDNKDPEGQDNTPQDNTSSNGGMLDVDKELKVQDSIRVQEAHSESQKALLDESLLDPDQVDYVAPSQAKLQDGKSTENGNVEKQIGDEFSPSNQNADYDTCVDNDNHIFHTSSLRNNLDLENQQEPDPRDKVTGTCKEAGVMENGVKNDAASNVQNSGNIFNSSKILEFWVPVLLSNVQLEQYCATLLSNAMFLRSYSKGTVGGALHDIFISNRKCCNHPYVVDPTLHSKILKDQEPTMLKLDADIKASGKLQFLDLILPEVKKRQLRVLILFQSTIVTTKGFPSVGEMLYDFVHQRFGQDSYEGVVTGLQPATKQAALNKFNKDMSIPVFLLEQRLCHASIKLSSVDIIVIFDSDLTPANDLKALQKISIDSQSERIMIFRLYSSSTLEEKILKLACSRLDNVRSKYNALLQWGASDLFDRLSEFHHGSVFSISSEESFLKDVVEEFLYLISNKCESHDSSKSIITRVQNCGTYGKNISFHTETKTHIPNGDQPHIFWRNLFEGRRPNWKFVSISTPRQRKRPHYFDCTTKGTSTEDGGGVKIRRKTVKPVIEGETRGVNEGGSGVPAHNKPQSSSDRFQSTAVSNEKSLQDVLKATMSELSNVLKLSDDVKIIVENFLEFVLENYQLSSEHTSTLQAFMISLCWIGSALLNIKIDRLESFDIAKKHLNFICQLEEAYSVYGKLQPAKELFVQYTERPDASKVCIPSPQGVKPDTEKCQLAKFNREEINKFYREWEEKRANLDKNYRMDQARIHSMHSNPSVRSKKLTQLKENFFSKLEKHGRLREVYLKDLKVRQVRANDGHPLHGSRHDEAVDRSNVSIPNAMEGEGVYDIELTGSHTSEEQMTDAMVLGGPIGEVSTQHHDDIENDVARKNDFVVLEVLEVDSNKEIVRDGTDGPPAVEHHNETGSTDVVSHVESPKMGMPAGNCNKENGGDGTISHDTSYAVEDCNGTNSSDMAPEANSTEMGTLSGNCNEENAADGTIIPDISHGGEDRSGSCGSSSNLPSADVSAEVTHSAQPVTFSASHHSVPTIPESENKSLQVQQRPHSEFSDKGPAGPNSQIILENSSLDPHDEPSLISENQSGMLPQSEILLEPTCAEPSREQLPDLSSAQIPEVPTPPVTAEIQNLDTSPPTLNMFDNVNHVDSPTQNHANPLQAEEERLRAARDDVIKLHEETTERLKSDCEKEIAKMAAQISVKYEAKRQDEEAAFHVKKMEIDANVNRALMNKILAAAFRSKCQDLTLSFHAEKQHGSQTGIMQQLQRLSGSCLVEHSLTTASTSSCQSSGGQQTTSPPPSLPLPLSTLLSMPTPMPLVLQSQPPLQIVHQPADLFSSTPIRPPPNTNCPTIPSTTSTTSSSPVINPITPSSTANQLPPAVNSINISSTPTRPAPTIKPIGLSAANQRVNSETLGQAPRIQPPVTNGEVRALASHMQTLPRSEIRSPAPHLRPRAPAPHIRPFRPPSYVPPDFATQRRMLPGQHVTSTPLTSPSKSPSPVLPPLPISSTQPQPPLPPEPYVAPPPPPPPGSSPQPMPPPPPSGSSPQPLPPLPVEPYIVPSPPRSPPPSSFPATSDTLPHTSSYTQSPQIASIPTSGGPSLTLTDNLNALLNDNATRLPDILPTTPNLSTHSTGPEFICLLDDN